MKKIVTLISILSIAPLLSGCLSGSGTASDLTVSSEKYESYADRQKCQDTSEGGEGKRVCY